MCFLLVLQSESVDREQARCKYIQVENEVCLFSYDLSTNAFSYLKLKINASNRC